ncbi:hypothetical protein T10_11204 [Trichinella papuae]|uniref:Uncharacterized protein n=1 Tax=Trichinella papuae TaxID=268474 RepID=A0A0V1N9S8_9BILA|nr:hypothetical protein T10_11204 [Trichinella papuae]
MKQKVKNTFFVTDPYRRTKQPLCVCLNFIHCVMPSLKISTRKRTDIHGSLALNTYRKRYWEEQFKRRN